MRCQEFQRVKQLYEDSVHKATDRSTSPARKMQHIEEAAQLASEMIVTKAKDVAHDAASQKAVDAQVRPVWMHSCPCCIHSCHQKPYASLVQAACGVLGACSMLCSLHGNGLRQGLHVTFPHVIDQKCCHHWPNACRKHQQQMRHHPPRSEEGPDPAKQPRLSSKLHRHKLLQHQQKQQQVHQKRHTTVLLQSKSLSGPLRQRRHCKMQSRWSS